jgi:hypothetical protein
MWTPARKPRAISSWDGRICVEPLPSLCNRFEYRRALKSCGWSKKKIGRVAKARNADLRDLYSHNTSHIHSWQLVFVDESGCDKRIGQRRTGWAPLGVTPIQVSQFQREQRYQILSAYSQDGVLFVRIFKGSTDSCLDIRVWVWDVSPCRLA